MIYADTFTVAAATAKTALITREIELDVGVIHLIEITYLDGPENEVEVVVRRALHQIVPSREDTSIVGNNTTVRAFMHEVLDDEPLAVEVDAWSPNADFEHEITVRVHVLPQEVISPPSAHNSLLERIARTILGSG